MKIFLFFLCLLSVSSLRAISFEDWLDSYSLAGDDADPDADPDHDQIPNLLEYAFADLDPTVIDQAPASMPQLGWLRQTGSNRGDWEWVAGDVKDLGLNGVWHSGLRWTVRPGVEGIRYVPQIASKSTLRHWYDGRSAWIMESIPGNVVQAVAIVQGQRQPRFFMRVMVVQDGTVGGGLSGISAATTALEALVVDTATAVPRATGAASTEFLEDDDLIILRSTDATQLLDYRWHYAGAPTNPNGLTVNRSSSDPAIIKPSSTDPYLWDYQSPGTAVLQMRTSTSTYTQSVTTTTTPGATVDSVAGVVTGSLRKHLDEQIDARIAGKTAPLSIHIFSTQDHTGGTYVRNEDGWGYDIDLTPLSPWNSTGGAQMAGTLISPRHMLVATHYQPATGATVRFVTADNTVVTRTITAKQSLTITSGYHPDFTVCLLDSDVPETISFCRVLPDNWATKLSTLDQLEIAAVGVDQEEKLLVMETGDIGTYVRMMRPADAHRASFNESIVGGDSGNPGGLIINGKFVLLTVWTSGGGGSGSAVTPQRSAINAAMTSLGGGYTTLTDVDLSSYATY